MEQLSWCEDCDGLGRDEDGGLCSVCRGQRIVLIVRDPVERSEPPVLAPAN